MSALTIRLPNEVVTELDMRAHKLRMSRSEYIRESIKLMNKGIYDKERKSKLIEVSKRVKKESMIINYEFSEIEYDPEV